MATQEDGHERITVTLRKPMGMVLAEGKDGEVRCQPQQQQQRQQHTLQTLPAPSNPDEFTMSAHIQSRRLQVFVESIVEGGNAAEEGSVKVIAQGRRPAAPLAIYKLVNRA